MQVVLHDIMFDQSPPPTKKKNLICNPVRIQEYCIKACIRSRGEKFSEISHYFHIYLHTLACKNNICLSCELTPAHWICIIGLVPPKCEKWTVWLLQHRKVRFYRGRVKITLYQANCECFQIVLRRPPLQTFASLPKHAHHSATTSAYNMLKALPSTISELWPVVYYVQLVLFF